MPFIAFVLKFSPIRFLKPLPPHPQLTSARRKFEIQSVSRRWRDLRQCVLFGLAMPFAFSAQLVAQDSRTVQWDPNPDSNIAGYIVYLGTSSGQYVTIKDVGTDTSHQFTGLSSTAEYYCAVQAYNTSGLTSELSAELMFTLQNFAVPYSTWASNAGLNGAGAEPSAMPFHDGVRNMMKYAFNMNAAGPDTRTLVKGTGNAGLPVFSLDRSGSQPKFVVEFVRRRNSVLVYTPKTSTDLGSFVPMTGTSSVTNIDSNWERVILEKNVDPSTMPRLFGLVEVSMP